MAAGFSYAQAAKGISSTSSSTESSSKAGSDPPPSKEVTTPTGSLQAASSGLECTEDGESPASFSRKTQKELESLNLNNESNADGNASLARKGAGLQQGQASGIASPDFGTASSSTFGKDDDGSSIANASSESTWENKSQASTSVERLTDSGEVPASQHSRKTQHRDKTLPKPLNEAPPPAVNVWKQRAEDARKPKPSSQLSKALTNATGVANGSASRSRVDRDIGATKTDSPRKSKHCEEHEQLDQAPMPKKDGRHPDTMNPRYRDDDRVGQVRRDSRSTKNVQKDETPSAVIPIPPANDETSWPTPETAQDEDRKKSTSFRPDKDEKDRQSTSTVKSHGKNEWTKMAYTPTVVFNTPLPNGGNRRGGRGGVRGTSQATSRGGSHIASAIDRDLEPQAHGFPADASKEVRSAGPVSSDALPEKSRRASSIDPASSRDKAIISSHDRAGRANGLESQSKRIGVEDGPSSQSSHTNGSFAKHMPATRQRQLRKFDAAHVEKSKDDAIGREHASMRRRSRSPESFERKTPAADFNLSSSKNGANDKRSGHFDTFPSRQRGEGRNRGSLRGGRGGQHSSSNTNNQSGNHVYANGHAQAGANGSFTDARSPIFPPEQAGSYFGPPSQHLRSFRGISSRSQPIPVDAAYTHSRTSNGYQPSLPPIQTYGYNSYDHTLIPHPPQSAMPYTPYIDQYQLISMIQMQIEYYFSVENLCKDMFLRKNMDSQGFVFLNKIAEFNRIKQLTTDMDLLRLVCYDSSVIDYQLGSDGKDMLRRRDGWQQWVLPVAERDDVAKTDGPDELHHPPVPHARRVETPHQNQQFLRHPPSAPVTGPASPDFTSFLQQPKDLPVVSVVPNGSPLDFLPIEVAASRKGIDGAEPSIARPGMNPEADSFSDAQVEGLRVIVRHLEPGQAAAPFHSASSRTFSNGSIDSRNISEELHNSETRPSDMQSPGPNVEHGEDRTSSIEVQRSLKSNVTAKHAANSLKVFWVKDKDKPVDKLPPESTGELYTHLHDKALQERQIAVLGFCPYDMDVLYQFWSHFLIRNFNTRMYEEFRSLAFEDVNQRMSDSGIKSLIKYYGEALSSQSVIRLRVARHYVQIVEMEQPGGGQPAFKQLRSAWRNGALNMKNRKRIGDFIEPALKTALEGLAS